MSSADAWLHPLSGLVVLAVAWIWVRAAGPGFGCAHAYHITPGSRGRSHLCCRRCGRGLVLDAS